MFTLSEILDMAIQIEKNGETLYRKVLNRVTQPELISLLDWMAAEEVQHASWLSAEKKKLTASPYPPLVEEMNRELLHELLEGQSFSLEEKDFSQIETIKDLIHKFIEFENDTVIFYELLQPFIEDEVSRLGLEKIIKEEKQHIQRLESFLLPESEMASG